MNNMNNQINQNNINNQMNDFHNIQNCSEQSEFKKIIKQKENPIYPHKTGLQNLGHTSYMNSVIQCLSNIKYLSNYLIKHYGKFHIDKQPLSLAFSSFVYDLFTTKKKYISTKIFKKIIDILNPLFEGFHEVDPKYLLIFLLGKLYQELNKVNNLDKFYIDYNQLEKDSLDENKSLLLFFKFFVVLSFHFLIFFPNLIKV